MVAPSITANSPDSLTFNRPLDGTLSFTIEGADGVNLSTLNVVRKTMDWAVTGEFPGTAWRLATNGSGTFVVVGADHTASANGAIWYSTDSGASWSTASIPTVNRIRDVHYANGIFVAVGQAFALRSTDGISWTQYTFAHLGVTDAMSAVAYGNGYWVVQGNGTASPISTDAITWVAGETLAQSVEKLSWDNTNSVFISVSFEGNIYTVNDPTTGGDSWTFRQSATTGTFREVATSSSGTSIAVGGENDVVARMYRSTNGTTWAAVTALDTDIENTKELYGVGYANGIWFAGGANNLLRYSTDDGVTWHRLHMASFGYQNDQICNKVMASGTDVYLVTRGYQNHVHGRVWKAAASFTDENAITNGSLVSPYDGGGSSISSIANGYDVVLERTGDWEADSYFGFEIDAESTLSDVMDTAYLHFHTHIDGVAVVGAQSRYDRTSASSASTGTHIEGGRIPSEHFVTGHEYLIFATASVYGVEFDGDRGRIQLRHGTGSGVTGTSLSSSDWSGITNWSPWHIAVKWTAVSGDDVWINAHYLAGTSIVAARFRLMALDLTAMADKENESWWLNANTNSMDGVHSDGFGSSYKNTFNMVTVSGATINDGETFTLEDDNGNPAVTFEFDKSGDGVTPGNTEIDIVGTESDFDIADLIETTITNQGSLDLQAYHPTSNRVEIRRDPSGVNDGTHEINGSHTVSGSFQNSGFHPVVLNLPANPSGDYLIMGFVSLAGLGNNADGFARMRVVETDEVLAVTGRGGLNVGDEAHQYGMMSILSNNADARKIVIDCKASPTIAEREHSILIAFRLEKRAARGGFSTDPDTIPAASDTYYSQGTVNYASGSRRDGLMFGMGLTDGVSNTNYDINTRIRVSASGMTWVDPDQPVTRGYHAIDGDPNEFSVGAFDFLFLRGLAAASATYDMESKLGTSTSASYRRHTLALMSTEDAAAAPPGQVTNPDPADDATDVVITKVLGWVAGSGITDSYNVYFGTDEALVASRHASVFQGNQPGTSYDPGGLAYGTEYFWAIDPKNTGGTTTGVVWSFWTPGPDPATGFDPFDTETNVAITKGLSWVAGTGATAHDVYFGDTNPPIFRINQSGVTYDPGTLNYGTTYYWRIDERNDAGVAVGSVISFQTVAPPPVELLGIITPQAGESGAGMDPASGTAGTEGGDLIIIRGNFTGLIGTRWEVFIGPNGDDTDTPALSGIEGDGFIVTLRQANEMRCFAPALDPGVYSIYIRREDSSRAGSLSTILYVVPPQWGTQRFHYRRLLPPTYALGPRSVSLLPSTEASIDYTPMAPILTGPVAIGTTTVNGTSIHDGGVITVLKDGVQISETTVESQQWSASVQPLQNDTDTGIVKLSTAISVNSQEVSPLFRYNAGVANTSELVADGYGVDLPKIVDGTDPLFNQPPPTFPTGNPLYDPTLTFQGGSYYQAALSASHDLTSEDLLIECIVRCPSAAETLFAKYLPGGYLVRATASTLNAAIHGFGGSLQDIASGTVTPGNWYHFVFYVNRDEASTWGGRIFLNGVPSGTGQDFTSQSGSLASTNPFIVGAYPGGTSKWTTGVLYFAGWARDNWFQAGQVGHDEIAAFAEARYEKLVGLFKSLIKARVETVGGVSAFSNVEELIDP